MEKLKLSEKTQACIKHRRRYGIIFYAIAAIVLVALCFVLTYVNFGHKQVKYKGLALKSAFTATFTGNIYAVGDGEKLNAKDYEEYFSGVRDVLDNSDYISANICDPLLSDEVDTYTTGFGSQFADRYFNDTFADALTTIGVTEATFCSSDMFRYASKGVLESAMATEANGILTSGLEASKTTDAAICSEFTAESGLTILHVGIEATTDMRDYTNYIIRTYNTRDDNCAKGISILREEHPDALIAVTISWTSGYTFKPSAAMQKLSRKLIDAGANIVIGGGVRTTLPCEDYNGGIICYGLGNLISNEAYVKAQQGVLLNYCIADDGAVTLEFVPLDVLRGKPELITDSRIAMTLASGLSDSDIYKIKDGILTVKLG